MKVRFKRLVLRLLLHKLSLGLGASGLDHLLANDLLCRTPHNYDKGKRKRDYEQLKPISERLSRLDLLVVRLRVG